MEVKGKIIVKKSDNKAFKFSDEQWYNVNSEVIPVLEKMNKGDEVIIIYEQKGVSRHVSQMNLASTVTKEKPETSEVKFKCEICGTTLKDGKYKKCYKCNKSGATKPQSTTEEPTEFKCEDCGAALKNGKYKKCYKCGKKANQGTGKGNSFYGSPEDIAGKETGCALSSAATVASGCGFSDPDTAKQFTLTLAEAFLEWMRLKK